MFYLADILILHGVYAKSGIINNMNLSTKIKVAFTLGLILVVSSIFFFGDGFISNLLWQGCYDGGFPGNDCVKSDEIIYKAYKATFLFLVGIILIIYGFVDYRKK